MCKFNPKNDTKFLDPCMKNLINMLNKVPQIITLGCCCGHKKYHITIVYRCKDGKTRELISDIQINRKKRFYKKDKKGVYYIPEAEEYWSKERTKNYYKHHKKQMRYNSKKWELHNKDRRKEYNQKYYEKNKEIINKKNQIYRQKNKKRISKRRKENYKKKRRRSPTVRWKW